MQNFISTSAKVLLNDWKPIVKIIKQHTAFIKVTHQTDADQEYNLISDRELSDALSGPYSAFIQQKLTAYAVIGRARLYLNLKDNEDITYRPDETSFDQKIRDRLKSTTLADLQTIQSQLNDLVEKHHEIWQKTLKEWDQHLATTLAAHEIPLNDVEIKVVQEKEPLSELLNRLTDLNLKLPSHLDSVSSYESYYLVKALLAIHSSPHRRHIENTEKDMQQHLKKIRSELAIIGKEEKQLLSEQFKEIEKVIVKVKS